MSTNTQLSPLRNTTKFDQPHDLAIEQAKHFGIDTNSDYGKALVALAQTLYQANHQTHDLWSLTIEGLSQLDRSDRIAWFNAKRFVSFQLAKILDNLQNPLRATYQSMATGSSHFSSKGAYPLFDNVTAIFSANPVITRTATYLFACSEWVEDAFNGREPLHEIYSRLLNPTSISLANHIVDIECGELANQYMAWNFNSGMSAIDCILSHLLGRNDIVLASRNIYGGSHQLLNDWYKKKSNLDIALEWVDGYSAEAFIKQMDAAQSKYAEQINQGRNIYVYIESPCNPHGYVLDVAGISKAAHQRGWRVITDTTIGTPFLHPVLKAQDPIQRPDFVIHSYTKDLTGTGTTTAGVVIGRNEDMFIPKGESVTTTSANGEVRKVDWDQSLFWNVYYIKGAFLDSDKAFEVLNGIKTFELRVLQKTINTITLAKVFDAHSLINVSCPVIESNPNHAMLKQHMRMGLPAPLFTINMQGNNDSPPIPKEIFKQFYDMLEPAVGMQVSLGQTNTVALCPALTSHSELSESALAQADISLTTMRIAVGLEDPRVFIAHIQRAGELSIDASNSEFSKGFLNPAEIDDIYQSTYLDVHQRFLNSLSGYEAFLS